jgi:hypothetical protein
MYGTQCPAHGHDECNLGIRGSFQNRQYQRFEGCARSMAANGFGTVPIGTNGVALSSSIGRTWISNYHFLEHRRGGSIDEGMVNPAQGKFI